MRLPMGILLSFLVLTTVSCTSNHFSGVNSTDRTYYSESGDRVPAGINKPARPLTDSEVEDAVSSDSLKLGNARVIIDNDESFLSKINAIDSAKPGETIRIVYYIYSNDQSSSFLTQKLIDKAKTGVKVKLLVDLITNYKNLDMFSYMQEASNGNIEVRLFGRPSDYVMRDALYLTKPCQASPGIPAVTECSSYKWEEITKELEGKNKFTHTDFYSALLLSSIYGKSPTAGKVALNYGQQLGQMKSQTGPVSPEQKAKLRELVKLVIDAKVFGKTSAYLKLSMAMLLYANDVNPVLNQIYGRFPFDQPGMESSLEHWEHITDYTHHKLLMVGDRFMQLGGRNIENSYHMKLNNMSAKYTFMDTDFAADIQGGGDDVADSYDKMWDYKETVVSIKELKTYLNNDFSKNPEALGEAVVVCETKGLGLDRQKMAECLLEQTPKSAKFKTLAMRHDKEKAAMAANLAVYKNEYYSKLNKNIQSWKGKGYAVGSGLDSYLSGTDLNASKAYYIENLPYKRNSKDRTLNFENGMELENNKNIHYLWLRGLENTCYESAKTNTPKRVILHSAYWFPSTNMLETLKKMMDGSWNCSLVTVQIITNSFETTDLNVLNVFARYQMKAFYGVYDNIRDDKISRDKKEYYSRDKAAKFEYYEYKPAAGTSANKVLSLHTKVSVLGDDVIVGSANADIRSYMMDTNNGVFIRNAREFVQDYTKWIDGILADKNMTVELSNQFRLPHGMKLPLSDSSPVECPNAAEIFQGKAPMPMNLHGQDMCFLEGLALKFKFLANLKQKDIENWNTLRSLQTAIAYDIYDSTRSILSERYWDKVGDLRRPGQGASPQQKRIYEKAVDAEKEKIQNSFNRKYQTF